MTHKNKIDIKRLKLLNVEHFSQNTEKPTFRPIVESGRIKKIVLVFIAFSTQEA